MAEIITAVYASELQASATVDDLVRAGVPRRCIQRDVSGRQVRVDSIGSSAPKISELLMRRAPTQMAGGSRQSGPSAA
jgi:hypothetical protein